jgi:hypothetical protein
LCSSVTDSRNSALLCRIQDRLFLTCGDRARPVADGPRDPGADTLPAFMNAYDEHRSVSRQSPQFTTLAVTAGGELLAVPRCAPGRTGSRW